MTATVRSVRVEMELGVARYVANARLVGRETDAMGDRIEKRFISTNRQLGDAETNLRGVSKGNETVAASTKKYSLEMAIAEERSRRLRESLRRQARASLDAADGIDRTDRSLTRTNRTLDTFSGRTGLILKALALVGPAVVPLSAGLVPALSLVATGGVAAAAGLGVTILAVQGLADAAKALDTWQLEKTPENLAAVRQEFARIGVDGKQFVQFLDSLEPKLRDLQLIARAGALPGYEDGIRNLLGLLPELKFLIQDISETTGDLATDAGASLAGEDFEAFFDYLKTDAAPTLDALSRVAGNFTLAFANLLVGLAPATRDATGGLLEFSEGLAEASANLDSNEGFQKFLAYVRREGPGALEFLGSASGAVVSLAQAASPYGSVVLPVLTATADLFSLIASSPVGPVLISAAAGLTLYGRAAAFAGPQIAKLKAGGLGAAAAGVNPAALGAAALVVAITQVVAADDELVAATKRAQDAINSGDTSQMRAELKALRDEIDATSVKMYEDPSAANALPFGLGMVKPGLEQAGNLWAKYSGSQEEAKRTEKELQDAIAGGGGVLTGYRNSILRTADAALQEAAALQAATDAMREKRQEALRGLNAELDYQQAIDDARKSLRENGATLDETTNKGRENLRNLYALAGAWNEQSDAAKNARGALAQAKSNFIETATAMDMPIAQARRLANQLFEIPTYRSTKVQVETEAAMSRLAALKNRYDAIRDKSVTISINSGGGTGGGSPMGVPLAGQADGGTIRGPRRPYGDKVLAYLAPGEEVISNRHGQADRARPLLKRINAGRFADGGTIPTYVRSRGWAAPSMPDGWMQNLGGAADRVVGSMKKLEARLDKVSTAYEKEKSKLDDLTSARQSAADAVASSLVRDPFGNGLAGFDAQVDADTADIAAMGAALATLVKNGLDPKSALYQQLAASGDVNTAEQLAALSSGELADRARRYEARASEASALGGTVAGQKFDESIRKQTKATERLERTMDELKAEIRGLKDLPDKTAEAVGWAAQQGTEAGAWAGTQKGQDEKRRMLAAEVRTGGGGRSLPTRGR